MEKIIRNFPTSKLNFATGGGLFRLDNLSRQKANNLLNASRNGGIV